MPRPGNPCLPVTVRSLYGRRDERGVLTGLVDEVRHGHSGVLVLRGEAGIGKTALLDHAAEAAADLRVLRATGTESERELPFAGLHQLCFPMLDLLGRLPGPQRDALEIVFGVRAGAAPDRFLVGVAVLSLLTEAAAERPLVCVIDGVQWLDRCSRQALAFVARRLPAEAVLLVFAVRDRCADLGGLPELVLGGLPAADARELLTAVVRWPLDERVRQQIVAETRGNPLALLELPGGLSPAQLAGGLGLPAVMPLPTGADDGCLRQLAGLPAQARLLLLIAAAEPGGDAALVWRAAGRLGIPAGTAVPAAETGLATFAARVVFRDLLARSAVYQCSPLRDRQAVHHALAEAADPRTGPDRRAWHRAQATPAPDEDVAAELERAAGWTRERGGLAAAAAFLERAAALTPDPARWAGRALAAAAAMLQAGAFDVALKLVDEAEATTLGENLRARAGLLRAQLAFAARRAGEAPSMLLDAARQLERTDAGLARATYLEAVDAALAAGHLATPGGSVLEVARAAQAVPAPGPSHNPPDLLVAGLAALFTRGYSEGLPILRQALRRPGGDLPAAEELRWLGLACTVARHLWDDRAWDDLSRRHVQLARETGALGQLPRALGSRAWLHLLAGELTAAAALAGEAEEVSLATGGSPICYESLLLAVFRGCQEQAVALIESTEREAALRGEGLAVTVTKWAAAVLHNGLARYAEALAAAEQCGEHPGERGLAAWSMAELIEAAVRTGQPARAAAAMRSLSETANAAGTDWALGVQARSLALLSEEGAAELLYQTAIDRLGRTRVRVDLARAHLLYGEWLRRENRRVDARDQLRRAHDMLTAMGADGFAGRARRELLATGETVRKRTVETTRELTEQEVQIAVRARDGHTNTEIGAELFLSPRTVEWHLRKVFAKLGISSRRQLHRALGSEGTAVTPVTRAMQPARLPARMPAGQRRLWPG